MPPYTYKFVKNQANCNNKKDKIGYLSKDVKVINDLIDDLSKLKGSNDATEMTNPLEIDLVNKSSALSYSSSSTSSSEPVSERPKLKEQVLKVKT